METELNIIAWLYKNEFGKFRAIERYQIDHSYVHHPMLETERPDYIKGKPLVLLEEAQKHLTENIRLRALLHQHGIQDKGATS